MPNSHGGLYLKTPQRLSIRTYASIFQEHFLENWPSCRLAYQGLLSE